jgi:hypothetical protein
MAQLTDSLMYQSCDTRCTCTISSRARKETHWTKVSLDTFVCELPPARVRTTVHVQDLPGDVTRLRQINDSIGNVLRLRDDTHR